MRKIVKSNTCSNVWIFFFKNSIKIFAIKINFTINMIKREKNNSQTFLEVLNYFKIF